MKTALMISFLFMGQKINIDLAVKPLEHLTGMMYRQEWTDANHGMLFINDKPRQVSFWMKDTYLGLSIFYLDGEYNILEVHQGKPLDQTQLTSKATNVQYILELNPAMEAQVRTNWEAFKAPMVEAVQKKEKDILRLKKPL